MRTARSVPPPSLRTAQLHAGPGAGRLASRA